MKRVLFAATETYSVVGGMQRFNQRIIRNLVALSDEGKITAPTVSILRDPPSALPRLASGTVAAFKSRWRLTLSLIRQARLHDVLLLGQINLLPLAAVARMVNPRIQIALFVHGEEVWNEPNVRRKRYYEPAMLAIVNKVAAVSAFTARVMGHHFGISKGKFVIFPNAVDISAGEMAPKLAPDHELILTVCRLGPGDRRKNVDKLIDALSLVLVARPQARLEIVGDGALRTELERLTDSLGLSENVRFLGQLSDVELEAAFNRASVFTLVSAQEGFGIVYLEAWLHRLPVVCGCHDASCEVVEHGVTGLVVDELKAESIAAALVELLSNSHLSSRLGAAGYRRVLTDYSNENFRQRLKDLIV